MNMKFSQCYKSKEQLDWGIIIIILSDLPKQVSIIWQGVVSLHYCYGFHLEPAILNSFFHIRGGGVSCQRDTHCIRLIKYKTMAQNYLMIHKAFPMWQKSLHKIGRTYTYSVNDEQDALKTELTLQTHENRDRMSVLELKLWWMSVRISEISRGSCLGMILN